MKYIKITIVLFMISLTFSLVTTFAIPGFSSVSGISLPVFGGTVEAATNTKSTNSAQYYRSFGTIDMLTSAEVNVKVKTSGSTGETAYITLAKNDLKNWGSSAVNIFTGSYTLIARREKSAITTATHSGSWYLDENKVTT